MKMIKPVISLLLVLCVVNVAYSQVKAYDTFGYEPGEIVGESGHALGFTGSWVAGGGWPGQCTVEEASLIYSGVDSAFQNASGKFQVIVPEFDGGRAARYINTDPNGPFGEYVNERGAIGNPGQSIYISYLMDLSHTSPFYAFELMRDGIGDDYQRLFVGNDVAGSNLQVCAYRNRDTSESNLGHEFQWLGEATTDTELIVIRIDFGSTGDNVTVHRNPTLNSEPATSPQLVNTRLLDFEAVSLISWVGPGGRWAQFDEICIATTYEDAVRFYNYAGRAQNPFPADGVVDVATESGVNLSWSPGNVSPASYDVYLSDNLDDVLAADPAAYQGTTADTSMPIATINTDTTYYWSVAAVTGTSEIPGVIWMFETYKTLPVPVNQPVRQQAFVGESASFTFDVSSESPATYQWYDADGEVVNNGNISGANTQTLTIAGVDVINEGEYYCEVTNSAGTIASESAKLIVKRIVGDWNFNQPAGSDPSIAWQDLSASGNDLQVMYTEPNSFSWVDGADGTVGGALDFDGQFAFGTTKTDGTMNNIPIGDDPYTLLVWFKTTPETQGLLGWGNFGSYNQCNALAMYGWDENYITNYWWDNDLGANRGFSIQNNEWHQVVATYDGDERIIYIDGIHTASDNPKDHAIQTTENFLIGKTNTTNETDEFFIGAMDHATVYNYSLSPVEVAKSYTDITGEDLCMIAPAHDLTGDCRVDINDFAAMAASWLDCGLVPSCID